MYFLLSRSWAENPARRPDRASYDRQGLWWNNGSSFSEPPSTPIDVKLTPLDQNSPDESSTLPEFIDGVVPLMSDHLVANFRAAGVDNFDLYDARLFDPDNGQFYTNYKAVNIVGLVAAADMQASDATIHDGIPLIDVSFHSLVIDDEKARGMLLFRLAENNGAILVHQQVRDHLVANGFEELEFYDLTDSAI